MKEKLFCFIVLIFLPVEAVFAHATPITYSPEASAVLEKAPGRVVIRFSENIEPVASGITIYGPDGNLVGEGDATISINDAHEYSVGLRSTGEGTHSVSWQVVSADDGHFTKGAYVFSIGKETALAAESGKDRFNLTFQSTPQEGFATGMELVGASILFAFLVMLSLIWRPLLAAGHAPLRQGYGGHGLAGEAQDLFEARITKLVLGSAMLVIVGALTYLAIKGLSLKEFQQTDLWTAFKSFFATSSGMAALWRAGIAAAFIAVFSASKNNLLRAGKSSASEFALYGLIFLHAYFRVKASHGSASELWPVLTFADHIVQLLSKSFWVGGVIVLVLVMVPALRRAGDVQGITSILRRFSFLAAAALGLMGLSGAYIVWLDLKDPVNILLTAWGSWFVALSLFGGLLVFMRLCNQAVLPVMLAKDPAIAWSLASLTLPLEMFTGIGLLIVTGFILITTPPVLQKNLFERRAESRNVVIELSKHAYEDGRFLVSATDDKGVAAAVAHMVVTLTNAEFGIGPVVADTEKRFEGGYVFNERLLSPPGNWRVDITAQRKDAYDAVASFTVAYPADVISQAVTSTNRRFGNFEIFCILSGLGAAMTALALIVFTLKFTPKVPGLGGGDLPTQMEWSWFPAFFAVLAFSLAVFVLKAGSLKSEFQKSCEYNGAHWHQMVPIRNYKVTSQIAVSGCMTGNFQDHFADEREYAYFLGRSK